MNAARLPRNPTLRKILFGGVLGVWLAIAIGGAGLLAAYSLRPGEAGQPADVWPQASRLARGGGDQFDLVVALHPECPCSRATVEELNMLMTARPGALHVHVLFSDAGTVLSESGLWRTVRHIPGVNVVDDHDGAEARHFAVHTSGETRLYASDGSLCFRGGITGARGHVGNNAGRAAILAALDARSVAAGVSVAPVFGCGLFAAPTEVGR